jgi:RNA polymerase sigma-70 factor, ECF subfamily
VDCFRAGVLSSGAPIIQPGEHTAEPPAGVEGEVRRLCASGETEAATVLALRHHGGELLGLLVGLLRDEDAADDVFSRVCQRVWRGMAGFGWQCSLRAWLYVIARNAARQFQRDEGRRARHERRLGSAELVAVAEHIRSATRSWLRTEDPRSLARLRERLPEEDRLLLILRVDRGLQWLDLARVFVGSERAGGADLAREAARLRKRFQLVRERVVRMAREEGLLR